MGENHWQRRSLRMGQCSALLAFLRNCQHCCYVESEEKSEGGGGGGDAGHGSRKPWRRGRRQRAEGRRQTENT
jgi:hypothetical protein